MLSWDNMKTTVAGKHHWYRPKYYVEEYESSWTDMKGCVAMHSAGLCTWYLEKCCNKFLLWTEDGREEERVWEVSKCWLWDNCRLSMWCG